MTLALQQEAKSAGHEYPLLIGIDQENGLVTRICPPIAAQLPGPMTLGATQSPELAYKVSKGTGDLLNYFGINMNYAPVCDVNSEPLNPVIGVRSPGDDPDFVGRFASAAAQGLRDCKIVPSAKHFPGHGDTAVDSHYGLPAIFKDRDQLERWELVPFRRCVAEGVETVMTAHIALPAIGDGDLPATLSADALNILRKDMNYDGMIVSDCLEMDGVRATYGTERGSVLALNAGCDSIMICHTYDVQLASVERVVDAVQCGVISASRLEQAFNRVQRVKETFTDWETALRKDGVENLASINKENEALAKEAYSQSATLVRSKPGVLPLSSTCKVVLLLPGGDIPAGGAVDGEGMGRKGSYKATYYTDILRSHNAAVVEIRYGPAGLSTEQWNSVTAADAVVLITINAMESPYQRSLGFELSKRSQAVVAVAACSPYDFLEDFDIDTYIATYEPTAEAFKAVADVIFGVASARGSLPVTSKSADNKSVTVAPLVPEHDLDREATIWNAALPNYALPKESLQRLLAWPSGCHFVARVGYTTAGLCIAYAKPEENGVGHIAVVVVEPPYQNKGVGTALLMETKSYFRRHFNVKKLVLGSTIPRFWPGIPEELPSEVHEFFVHRGFRALPDDWSRDLYRDIRNFQAPEEYVTRARDEGYTFCPLRPEHHRECVVAQMKNFSTYDVSNHQSTDSTAWGHQ